VSQALLIQLPKFFDERGNLSFFENMAQLPFAIRRVHWIYDVPGGETRGGLAYMETEEFVVAMSGSFDVTVDDGVTQQKFSLNRSYLGLYIPKGTWRSIDNFSTNSVAVIAASTHYDPDDTIRNYQDFIDLSTRKQDLEQMDLHLAPTVEVEGRFSVFDCSIIELDRHHSKRKGDISVVENGETVPFDVKRVYYLYDVPGGVERGGHAHKALSQFIVAVSGAFTVTLNDGKAKRSFTLNRPYQGLLVKPGIWRDLSDFSSGSVCLVLASEKYDASDYIRDFDEFLKYRR
jgi:dTDP-4-dehydrorhamnose 3,5-epimerase-like enzyme